MTSPRLPLVKAQRSFLSGIRPSREQHGPKVKVTAPPKKKTEVRNSRGVSFEVRKIPLRFRLPFFIGGAVTLSPWSSILRRISDKNDHCASTRGNRGEVMIFFEKNKVLGVEPNRVLNILEGIQKINTT